MFRRTKIKHNSNSDRISFLDHLRYLMVLLVVVLHAAISYSNFGPWWSVKEANESSVFFDVVLLLFDVFPMPILFFIAGYFAIPSFRKKGRRLFLGRKFKRLGLPLLLTIPLISPLFGYIHHYTRHGYSSLFGFGEYWLDYMKSALDFRVKILTSVDQFSHSHLWFMSLLLFFFILFAVLARNPLQRKPAGPKDTPETASHGSILALLAGVGFLTMLSTFIADSIFANPSNPDPWVSIANVLQFQPGKVISYALYFGMGAYAFHKKWFVAKELPGRLSLWTVLSILLSLCYLAALKHLLDSASIGIYLLFLFVKSFFCVSSFMAFTIWAHLHWTRPSRIDALLASNSYFIYITHLFIVIILQLVLSFWSGGPALVKFGMIVVASVFISCGISQYALRPHPRLTVIGIYAVWIIVIGSFHPK